MKKYIITIALLLFTMMNYGQAKVSISDIEILNNTKWKGVLTYIDYQSGKSSNVEATLDIKIENDKIISNVKYTYEPNKNNKAKVKIKKNGTYYGNEKVVSNTYKNGKRILITSYEGKDNGRKAKMFNRHEFNDYTYTISKKVVYKNTNDSIIRNTYKFIKTN